MQVWCALKFKTFFSPCAGLVHFEVQKFVFFVPLQVWCTLKLKPSVCFVPVEVWYDSWFAIKMCYFAGYWNCLFKHDVFSLFAFFDSGFITIILFDLGGDLNLIKTHFVFKNRVSFPRKLF